jgi:hypothetical protein
MIWEDAKGSDHVSFNPLNAELNPICHLLALVEAHHILHVSRIRVKGCPGTCPERIRTTTKTSVMTMCVIHPGIWRVQGTVLLSYDKLFGQKN